MASTSSQRRSATSRARGSAAACAIGAALCLAACSWEPRVHFVPTDERAQREAKPVSHVRVYLSQPPSGCTYEQVGYVQASSGIGTPEETLALVRARAAAQGADAVVLKHDYTPPQRGQPPGNTYSGMAIVFTSGDCNARTDHP